MTRQSALALGLALAFAGCRARPAADPAAAEATAATAAPADSGGIPVRVAAVSRATVSETVSGSGQTAAMSQQKIRAPFTGTLIELTAVDGDRVRRGQALGAIVSRDSEAAVSGAREMAREASTPAEKRDAERALALAERGVVRAPITASASGIVLSHAAAQGDRVTEDQEILTLAEGSSLVFLLNVAQSDLARVHPGQTVEVRLAGRAEPVTGTVHDVLPGANAADFTVPVRVDLGGLSSVPPLGLFGTARIKVGEHRNAAVVPDAALVRDDVTGVTRIALVENGHARWVDATVGWRGPSGTEITSPALTPGQSLVISGQIGLPDGATVRAGP